MYKLERTTKRKEFHEEDKRPMGPWIPRKKKNASKSGRQSQPLWKRRMGKIYFIYLYFI